MAIEALENEAEVLRKIGGHRGGVFAEDAERQARQLREFAAQHAPKRGDDPDLA